MNTKNKLFLALAVMIMSQPLFSQVQENNNPEKEPNKKLELKPYGFIKGDLFYGTAGVTSFGIASLAAPQVATGVDQSAIGFTAQHTRLGLKASIGDNIKASGLVEIDFFTNAFDANAKPRIRLAYASVAKGGFEARFGQQWDLFSPNNANTNNTNGNMWFAGNKGFRRAQIQLSYKLQNDFITPMIQLSLGETSREEAGLGKDNFSGVPMLQGRLSGTIKGKYIVGVSYVYGQYLEKAGTVIVPDTLQKDFTFSTSGIGFDFILPIHKYFSLLGEVNSGTNLNNANLFSVANNHYWSNDENENIVEFDKKSLGFWFNATSKITDWFIVTIGYGMDMNNSDTYKKNDIDNNTSIYGNLTFPIKHGFSIALEFQNINTTVVTATDINNKISERQNNMANIISLSGKINF